MKSYHTVLSARVIGLLDVTPTVREFTLQLPAPIASWQVGAHVQVYLETEDLSGSAPPRKITRHYSLLPVSAPDQLRIAVKLAEPSKGGSRAMWRLLVGDSLDISEPMNHFALDLFAPSYLLVAGGIGITPLLSMAHLLRQRGASVQMIYAARHRQEWAYAEELQRLLADQLQLLEGSALDADQAIAHLPAQAQAYVCGPNGMLSALQKAWSRAGRNETLLRFETFGAAAGGQSSFEVSMPRHALQFEVQPEMSLLDAIEQHGIQAMWGCRKGECGLCALPVLSLQGEIEHRDVFFSEHEKRSNTQICPCVSRVRGSITLDSAFRPDLFNSAISAIPKA